MLCSNERGILSQPFFSCANCQKLVFDNCSIQTNFNQNIVSLCDAQSISDQSSSDDNDSITDRFNKKLISNNKSLNQLKQLNDNQDEINKCDDDDDKRIYSFKNNKLTSKEDSIDTYLSKCELAKSSKDSHIRLSPINKDYFEIFWKQSEYKLIIKLLRLENLRLNNQNQYSHIYLKLDLLPAIYKVNLTSFTF
ncbi:unnamed protein product [Rotaria sordida]|uniref:Uncharacterized protein n=1 Tax=Rotaria sordida TaxID=392033 RepID=A0A816DF33_9BILA|nr:unnamed protein product [Rotaria sordida]CAF1636460.1 unnamed protein product [Rotaria sordida]